MENTTFLGEPGNLDLHAVESVDDSLYLESVPDGMALDGWSCLSTVACPVSSIMCVASLTS